MLFKSIRFVCYMALVLCGTDAYSNNRDEVLNIVSSEERSYPRYHKRSFQNTTSTFLSSTISTTSTTVNDVVSSSPVFTSTVISTPSSIVSPTTVNLPESGPSSSGLENGISNSIGHAPSVNTIVTLSIASGSPHMQISSILSGALTSTSIISSPLPILQQSESNTDKATPTVISTSITILPTSNDISGFSSNSALGQVASATAASTTQNQLPSLASSRIQAVSMSTVILPSSTSVIESQVPQTVSGIPTSETMLSTNLATSTVPLASQGVQIIASAFASDGLNSSSNISPDTATGTASFTAAIRTTVIADGILPPSAPSNHSSWLTAGSVTSVYLSTVTPGPDFASSAKQNASAVPNEQSNIALNRTITSINPVITANETQLAASAITPTPAWTNQTAIFNASLVVAVNTQSSGAASSSASPSNTFSTGSQSGNQATSVKSTHSAPSSSPSQTVAAAAPPPLTTPQTAGIAVAGTTSLILAIVAAAYMIRRHQAKKARRASTGSAYPRIAFLYDPPNDGPDDSGELGSSETRKYAGTGSTPPGSKDEKNRDSNSWRYRFTDPGNPFGNHGTPLQKLDSAEVMAFPMPPAPIAVVSTAISRDTEGLQKVLPIVNDTTMPICNTPAGTVSMMSPVESEALSPSRQSILGEIASMAYNPRTSSHVASQYQPRSSSFGRVRSRSSPSLRQITVSRVSPKISEQDLLIHVDSRTETRDSATLFPTASARTSISPPLRVAKSAAALSLFPSVTQRSVDTESMSAQVNRFTTDSVSTATDSRRYTDDAMSSQRLTTSTRPDTLMSSISSSSPRPVHRGWEEIRRYSDEKVVPPSLASSSLISLSPPPTSYNPPPFRLKKKSLVQLRRKSPASARARQEMMSSSHLPLTVKIPFSHKQTSTFEIQNPKAMAKVDEAVSVANESVKLANLPPPPPPPAVPLPEVPQPKPEVVLPIASEMEKKKISLNLAHASA